MADKRSDDKTVPSNRSTVKPTAAPSAKKPAAADSTYRPMASASKKPATAAGTAAAKKPATAAGATAAKKPATTAGTTAAKKPSAAAGTTAAKKPSATAKPATAPQRPSERVLKQPQARTAVNKPAQSAAQKPSASAQSKPVATGASAGAQSRTAANKPTAKKPAAKKTESDPKRETAAAASAAKSGSVRSARSGRSGGAAAKSADGNQTSVKLIAIAAAAFVVAAALILGLVFGIRGCVTSSLDYLLKQKPVEVNETPNVTQVGSSFEDLGTTKRNKPIKETHDEGAYFGNSEYPKYGYTLSSVIGGSEDKLEARNRLILESRYFNANTTNTINNDAATYRYIDKDGWLYMKDGTPSIGNDGAPRRLYAHTASVGMYLGDVADSEPGVVKKMTFRKRSYSSYYNVTGLFAPAGEVIKVEMPKADFEATGGVVIHIGQALFNGQTNNIWAQKNAMNRMPEVLTTLLIDSYSATYDAKREVYTAYIGSFFGGPIYVRDKNVTFSMTISGAVNYSHFILGVTTEKDFEKYSKSTAPYFDLEVWDSGVLHSGPKRYSEGFGYEDIYKAAALWEKASIVPTRVANQGVVFLYEPFVAAGAAVAFPGRRSVNCPMGWMSSSLNYQSLVTSGAWGNFHEYHHNFQGGWGVGDKGEVSNNALTLVSYSLFTNISSHRGLGSYGGAGLSGWNSYTSATWALNRVNNGVISSTNGLAVYATLLHNLGQDAFIKSARGTGANYFRNWGNVTHQNMSYYISSVKSYTGDYPEIAEEQKDYPMFVPVSSVYQTGRSYMYDGEKRYIETMQPYIIPHGEPYDVDLSAYTVNAGGQYVSGSVVLPNGFTARVKSVDAKNADGKFEQKSGDIYTFTPGSEELSGKIYVTLEITKDDGAFAVDDVDLVLEFRQSREHNKNMLERTIYKFNEGAAPASAAAAFESGYAGNIDKKTTDNVNHVQNSNTDIWLSSGEGLENTVMEVSGKLFIKEAGKYRIALRARFDAALYISTDGETYTLAAQKVTTNTSPNFTLDDPATYFDYDASGEGWLYFKEVLKFENKGSLCFIGLGWQQWKVPQYTTTVDEDGVTHYFDESGKEVTPEEASNVDPIVPTSVSYPTAYRCDYEFTKQFESDYFYTKSYNYNFAYDNAKEYGQQQTLVSCSAPAAWGGMENALGLGFMFDGKDNTSFLSKQWDISEAKPFELVADTGSELTANFISFYGCNDSKTSGKYALPQTFTVYGSIDGKEYFEMLSNTDMKLTGKNMTVELNDTYTFRYYKIVVTKTDSGRFGMTKITFKSMSINIDLRGNGANHISPDGDNFVYRGKWSVKPVTSCFGHVYVGKKNATVQFEIEGDRFVIISSNTTKSDFDIYIDGKKVKSVAFEPTKTPYYVSYVSPELKKGKHNVVMLCKGSASFDSVAFYDTPAEDR